MDKDESTKNNRKKSGWEKLVNKFKKFKVLQETSTANLFNDSNTDPELAQSGSMVVDVKKPTKKDSESTIDSQAMWVSSRKSSRSKKHRNTSGGTETNDSTTVKKAKSLEKFSTRKSRRKKRLQNTESKAIGTITDKSAKFSALKTPSLKGRERADLRFSQRSSSKAEKNINEADLNRSFSQSFQRGLKTFRENRAKELRSVKTFISRQYNPNTMQKVLKQVEARQQKRIETDAIAGERSKDRPSSLKLHQGDDMFPTRKPRKPNNEKSKSKCKQTKSDFKVFDSQVTKFIEDGHVFVETNNNNDGELFIADGRPFWQQVGRGRDSDEDEDDDITDDELPMNAEIILKLHCGKISLTEMPTTPVLLDPYDSITHLNNHDKLFFSKDLIFSNTVRSMINLNDETTEIEKKKKHGIKRLVKFSKPQGLIKYCRNDKGEFVFNNSDKKNA